MDILIFVLALSILVLVHELGHFFAAKITGVRVDEFGLGLPPRIIGKKKWGTLWSLNWLPIGGFCSLYGEDPSSAPSGLRNGEAEFSFQSKNPWQKMLIVLGGVMMNLVLAILIFTVVYAILGVPKETERVKIIGVAKSSPAEVAGLKEDDWIKSIGGVEIKKGSELTAQVEKNKGKEIELLIDRNRQEEGQGSALSVQVLIREMAPEGEGLMGVVISNTEMEKIKWYQFYKGIGAGFKEAYFWGKIIAEGVFKMIGGLFSGQMPKDVSGPLGMYEATSSIRMNQGFLAMVHFFGVVSVNLAIVNILPFPALDGGRIIFVFYELLFKKKANKKFESLVNNLGMMILLGLILLVTIGDVRRIFGK
ncbi:MAG: M50 family metallopeptidase [Candidatus Shapirobacteria bacterium]|jgi:regulator of sigma E protease|nr:M50 family metallopeptidase [Candidatus Shapirobacteria bacterium]